MIGKKTKETFLSLLHDHNKTPRELASLVENNGVQYVSKWGDWQVALSSEPNDKDVIDAALEALATAASAFATNDLRWLDQYYDAKLNSKHHPLMNFGFDLDEDGKPKLTKTPIQTDQDLLKRTQSDLAEAQQDIYDLKNQIEKISTWTGFDDVDENLVPIELDVALMVYRDAIKKFNPNTGRMTNGDTPKEWIKDKVSCDYLKGQNSAAERISIVANWQKAAGRPSKL